MRLLSNVIWPTTAVARKLSKHMPPHAASIYHYVTCFRRRRCLKAYDRSCTRRRWARATLRRCWASSTTTLPTVYVKTTRSPPLTVIALSINTSRCLFVYYIMPHYCENRMCKSRDKMGVCCVDVSVAEHGRRRLVLRPAVALPESPHRRPALLGGRSLGRHRRVGQLRR